MNSLFKWIGRITGSGMYAAIIVLAGLLVVAAVVLSAAILKTVDGVQEGETSARWLDRYASLIQRKLVAPFQRTSVDVPLPDPVSSPAATAQGANKNLLEPDTEQHDGPGRKFGRVLRQNRRAAETHHRPRGAGAFYKSLPLVFSAPCADGAKDFDFEARGAGFSVQFREREVEIILSHGKTSDANGPSEETVRFGFGGGNDVRPKPLGRSAGEYHYLLGLRSRNWVTHAPAFPAIIYENIYADTDLVFYGTRERLEYVLLLGPDADPDEIALAFPIKTSVPVDGVDAVRVPLDCGNMLHSQPHVFTAQGPLVQPVAMNFLRAGEDALTHLVQMPPSAMRGARFAGGFDLASYIGGSGSDQIFDIVFDRQGHVYVLGETSSPNFSSNQDRVPGASDNVAAFVTKIRLADSMHVSTTFIGGRSQDRALAGAMGPDGRLLVCGETLSSDFPSDPKDEGTRVAEGWDGWFAALSPDGAGLERVNRIGGEGNDRCFDVDVDQDGNVWLVGETASPNLVGIELQADSNLQLGEYDGFVIRFSANESPSSGLRFGGREDDQALGIAVHSTQRAYLVGQTHSEAFPQNAEGESRYLGQGDAYLISVDVADTSLRIGERYRFGGRNADVANAVSVSDAGVVAVAGRTASRNLNTSNAQQLSHGGGKWDGFLATVAQGRICSLGYVGGEGMDLLHAVAIDSSGGIAIAGATSSTNLPSGNGAQTQHAGGVWDGFVSRYFGRVPKMTWCSYVGGAGADQLYAVAMDGARNIMVGGATASAGLPTPNGLQSVHKGGGLDAMFLRFPAEPSHLDMRLVPAGGQPNGPDYDFFMSRFEVTCAAFVRFLNDAQVNTNNARGAHMVYDLDGNVWMSAEQIPNRHELFVLWDSHLVYRPEAPLGARYAVNDLVPSRGLRYDTHPITGVSWFGAVKYCNWLTIDSGRGPSERCYAEGAQPADWMPVTSSSPLAGQFSAADREALLSKQGFRLPMDGSQGLTSGANRFNEFYKAACWSGVSNMVYGFGRNVLVPGDANYLDHGVIRITETTPAGYFDVSGEASVSDSGGNLNLFGISDLSGNVSEWITDVGATNATAARACYGGSYMYALPRIQDRFFVHPHFTDPFRGMRVVSTFREPKLTAVRVPMRICVCE